MCQLSLSMNRVGGTERGKGNSKTEIQSEHDSQISFFRSPSVPIKQVLF